ncbi:MULTISPECIES: CHAT domain-containing protein [unclassified Streptomyces]|uniref:CHAT domain-containing protein n=1 Tax=unclassified Streptomyces TaxID=2593676 RepID=UPI0004BF3096|nr:MULTISPECIES: CHAT domain-containing protein [unclassified Streptomyces]
MFVATLASCWSRLVTVPSAPPDPGAEAWVDRLRTADPRAVRDAVVAADDDRVVSAVITLLTRALSATAAGDGTVRLDGAGRLLLRIVAHGHGTGFPGGELASAHAHFLIGLDEHLTSPSEARRTYELAALAYRSDGAEALGLLASFASSTASQAALFDADFTEAHERLELLAAGDIDAAAALRRTLQPYQRVVSWAADVRAGRGAEERGPADADEECSALLHYFALSALDDPRVAARMSHAADAARPESITAESSLRELTRALFRRRQWADAEMLLSELLARDPDNRTDLKTLAVVYASMGRWPEGRALLTGLLGDPPERNDLPVLVDLCMLAHLNGDTEDALRWRQAIVELDPDSDPFRGLPGVVVEPDEPPPLLAALSDGKLHVSEELFELPQEEISAHMTAAVVSGSPDGGELLDTLFRDDPTLAERVLALLGLVRVTPEQAEAMEHFRTAEEHFAAGRLDDAQTEYEATLRLQPDHVQAMTYLGDTWYRRGAYHIAQAYFEESLAIEPTPEAYRFLGDALRYGGHGARRARPCYENALRLAPEYRGARQALAALEEQEPPDGPEPPDTGDTVVAPAVRQAQSGGPEPAGPGPAAAPGTAEQTDPTERRESVWSSPSAEVAPGGTGHGDRLVSVLLDRDGPDGFVGAVDDDERFARWVEAAAPEDLVRAGLTAVAVSFQYHVKDRDLPRWKLWVRRQVELAQALPADFGPAGSPVELGRDRLLADALTSLAGVRVSEGLLPEARAIYEHCLELLTAEKNARARAGLAGEAQFDRLFHQTSVRSGILDSLAEVCHQLGDHVAAQRHRREARRLDESRPTTEAEVQGFIAAADSALDSGLTDQALGLFQHALHLAEDDDPDPLVPRMLTTALNGLGRGHLRLGTARAALACFDRARLLNERTGNADRLAYDHMHIADVLRQHPELADAVSASGAATAPEARDARGHLEQALTYASVPDPGHDAFGWTATDGTRYRISAPNRAWPVLLRLGRFLQESGDDPAAVRFLTLATRLADLMRTGLVDDRQRIAVQNQRIEAFADLTKVLVRLACSGGRESDFYAEEAWLANESMRARAFLDELGDAELSPPPGVPADLLERERELLIRRRRLRQAEEAQDLGFWAEYRDLTQELDGVWEEMRRTSPSAEGYVEVRQARPADPADLTSLLDQGGRPAVLASLVRLDDGLLGVIALRGDRPTPVVQTRPVDMARLTRFVRMNFGSAGRVRELAVDAEDLFQHEMAPVADLLTAVCDPEELLIVCPVGALHHVPLGALRTGERILLERNPLALLPGASLLRALRSAAPVPAAEPAAVFGDPVGDLPGARDEAVSVAARFATTPLLGGDASTAAVRQALTTVDLLHVAAHARFDPRDALASGLVLSDGVLSAREILRLKAPSLSLVTLSACETGVSETDAAEELIGLTRALLFAGAGAMVVSLWKVPDLATRDMMSQFYDGLQSGAGKVDSLRRAVLNARDTYGPDRLDRWSGFQLIGDWR